MIKVSEPWQDIARTDVQTVVARPSYAKLDRGFELDRFAQPGFVGMDYKKGGLLLIGQNPGNGSSSGQSDGDDFQQRLLADFRAARNVDELAVAFEALMRGLQTRVMPTWKIVQNVVTPLLSKLGLSLGNVAYTNLMKFRTADRKISSEEAQKSWQLTTAQISNLEPRMIVCLGVGTSNQFKKLFRGPVIFDHITRAIGDSYLPDAARHDINRISAKWEQIRPS